MTTPSPSSSECDEYTKQTVFTEFETSLAALESILFETKIDWKELCQHLVLVGSRALDRQAPNTMYRKCGDHDFITTLPTMINWLKTHETDIENIKATCNTEAPYLKIRITLQDDKPYEFEVAHKISSSTFVCLKWLKHCSDLQEIYIFNFKKSVIVAPITLLYALKKAHIFWPIHWHKTIEDYHFIKTNFPDAITEFETNQDVQEFFKTRTSEINLRFTGNVEGSKPKNLDMSNEAFFKQSEKQVQRFVEHDFLHESVAFNAGKPLFDQFKVDKTKAAMSKAMFEAAPLHVRLQCVAEEAMVISLERYIIPDQKLLYCVLNPPAELGHLFREQLSLAFQMCYLKGLQRICTTLTSGWFRQFAMEHYPKLKFLPRNLPKLFEKKIVDHLLENPKFATKYDAIERSTQRFISIWYILTAENDKPNSLHYENRRSIADFANHKDFDTSSAEEGLVEDFIGELIDKVADFSGLFHNTFGLGGFLYNAIGQTMSQPLVAVVLDYADNGDRIIYNHEQQKSESEPEQESSSSEEQETEEEQEQTEEEQEPEEMEEREQNETLQQENETSDGDVTML